MARSPPLTATHQTTSSALSSTLVLRVNDHLFMAVF
jgi:hypothetical protein